MSRLLIVVALLIGSVAYAWPDFSGRYEDVERKKQIEVVPNGCTSFTMKSADGKDETIYLDGDEHQMIIPTPWKDIVLRYRGTYESTSAKLSINLEKGTGQLVYELSETGLEAQFLAFDAHHKEITLQRQPIEYRRPD